MDKILLQKLLIEILPDEVGGMVPEMITSMYDSSVSHFCTGLTSLLTFTKLNGRKEIPADTINGLFVGMALMHAANINPEALETIITTYLKDRAKQRGENVYNFAYARAKKI